MFVIRSLVCWTLDAGVRWEHGAGTHPSGANLEFSILKFSSLALAIIAEFRSSVIEPCRNSASVLLAVS